MEVNVPIREVTLYQSDDGRRVEVYKKLSEVKTEFDDKLKDQLQTVNKDIVYMGILEIEFDDGGVQDMKFEIETDSLEDAFIQFNEIAPTIVQKTHEALKKRLEEEAKERGEDTPPGLTTTESGIILPGDNG